MTNSGADKQAPAHTTESSIHIDDLLANGQGVGRTGQLVAFVSGALPGEQVRMHVDAVKARYLSAHAVAIEQPSPDRVTPLCPVFPQCGGCQTLHLRYPAQLAWKRRMVSDALGRLGGLPGVDVSHTQASPLIDGTRYRNKVSLVPRVAGSCGEIGFYAARSHRVVPIGHCPVLLPALDDAVRSLARFVEQAPAFLHDVRHIVMRTGVAAKTLVLCVSTRRPAERLPEFVEVLRQRIPGLTGVVSSFDPANDNAIFGRRFSTLWGAPETIEHVSDAVFHFGVASFFQINTGVLEQIALHIEGAVTGARRVVDLYCGVGTFAVMLGKRGIPVTGVESYRRAVDEAAANAAINHVTCAAFECAPVVEAVTGERGSTLLQGADAVILDPPRRGCEPEVLTALAGARLPHIEYISCNPATLARDARLLVDAGYRLERVTPFDMFPHTGHVEALAEFRL